MAGPTVDEFEDDSYSYTYSDSESPKTALPGSVTHSTACSVAMTTPFGAQEDYDYYTDEGLASSHRGGSSPNVLGSSLNDLGNMKRVGGAPPMLAAIPHTDTPPTTLAAVQPPIAACTQAAVPTNQEWDVTLGLVPSIWADPGAEAGAATPEGGDLAAATLAAKTAAARCLLHVKQMQTCPQGRRTVSPFQHKNQVCTPPPPPAQVGSESC